MDNIAASSLYWAVPFSSMHVLARSHDATGHVDTKALVSVTKGAVSKQRAEGGMESASDGCWLLGAVRCR